MFSRLFAYHERFGHCNVPQGWPDDPTLGSWVSTQRTKKANSNVRENHVQRLEGIGFIWNPIAAQEEQMFEELTAYKAIHGNCNVPLNWSVNRKLSLWVASLRARRLRLGREQIARFDSLGFIWDPQGEAWEKMFSELVRYKEAHGHCNVAQASLDHPRLGKWVATQRVKMRKGKLDQNRIQRLEGMGVVWEALERRWEEMFAALAAYKAKFGTSDVKRADRAYSKLRNWVGNQRQFRKRNKLNEDRIRRLDEVGFQWSVRDAQ